MTTYKVIMTTYATGYVEVDGDTEDEAIDKAYDLAPTLCAHCSGLGKEHSLELGDEWEIDTIEEVK